MATGRNWQTDFKSRSTPSFDSTTICPWFKSTKRLHKTKPKPMPFSPAVPLKLTGKFRLEQRFELLCSHAQTRILDINIHTGFCLLCTLK